MTLRRSYSMCNPSPSEAAHPSKVIAERLTALQISETALSLQVGILINPVTQIVNEQHSNARNRPLPMALFFGTAPSSLLDLRRAYDLRRAGEEKRDRIRRTVPTLSDVAKAREPAQPSLLLAGEDA